MGYATIAAVQTAVGGEEKLVQLTDRDSTGFVVDDVVDAAIGEADMLINSYAAKRWAVAALSSSTMIAALSAKMAARYLRRDNGVPRPTDEQDEDNDRKWLTALSKGEVSLGVDPSPAANDIVIDKAEPERDSRREVSRGKTKGFW